MSNKSIEIDQKFKKLLAFCKKDDNPMFNELAKFLEDNMIYRLDRLLSDMNELGKFPR